MTMKRSVIFYIAFAMLAVSSCKDSSTNPTTEFQGSVLMQSSFEDQGYPSLSSWQDGYLPSIKRRASYSFSNDVPSNGGKWSLKINNPDTLGSTMYIGFKPIQPSQMKQYRLTFSYKASSAPSNYVVEFIAFVGNIAFQQAVWGDSTRWTQDTLIYSSNSYSPDSLNVAIDMFDIADTSKYVLFDNFKVEEY
jgi:hypothetical protein